MLKWIKQRLFPALWRVEMEARIETAEAHLADLRARFTRFQNRENMRGARAALDGDQTLAEQVASMLGPTGPAIGPVDARQAKMNLWKDKH